MAWNYTADNMIESIKMRIRVPESQSTYTSTKFFKLIDEELERHVVPKIMACRENYFMTEEDTTIVSGQNDYKIPYRAIGGKVKALKYVDSQDNEHRMKQVTYESKYIYQDGDYNEPLFYIKRNSISIIPGTSNYAGGKLRFGYYLKPSSVVSEASCCKISEIDTSTNAVTVESSTSSFATGVECDLVRGKGGFECLAIDKSIVAVNTTYFTFSETLPTDLAVGDYVCLAQETPFPQIPADIHSYLTLRVCKTVLEGLGFYDEAKVVQKDLEEAESVFDTMLTPRTEGNPKKIINWFNPARR